MVVANPTQYPVYMIYDLIIQSFMPLLLLGSLAYMVYRIVFESEIYLITYLCTLIGVALLRSTYAIAMTRDVNFLYFPLYAFIHLFLLIPLRVYALFTISGKGWGTR